MANVIIGVSCASPMLIGAAWLCLLTSSAAHVTCNSQSEYARWSPPSGCHALYVMCVHVNALNKY